MATAKSTKQRATTQQSAATKSPKVLFVTAECAPFARTGGLGDVAGALPKALNDCGADVRVIMPLYEKIADAYRNDLKFLGYTYTDLGWRHIYIGVYEYVKDSVTYYFIDNEYYFKRGGLYGYDDDGERFAYFSKAVIDSCRVTGFNPDVFHANDWHSALTPVFLNACYKDAHPNARTVFTIHNIRFQGYCPSSFTAEVCGLFGHWYSVLDWNGEANCMKAAIECADRVNTVSPTYANEILTSEYGCGLETILRDKSYKLSGILNGIDRTLYNPETDKTIVANYGENTLDKKKANKTALCKKYNLDENAPLFGMVSRLTDQKGVDILLGAVDGIRAAGAAVIVLGQGDYEGVLMNYRSNRFVTVCDFSFPLAQSIYAGSDFFLMPSRFEPCGLGQIIAMRYGTAPIVRLTGGLKDTVTDITLNGTGLTFDEADSNALVHAVNRAVDVYRDSEAMKRLRLNCLRADFGWERSAKQYLKLYSDARNG